MCQNRTGRKKHHKIFVINSKNSSRLIYHDQEPFKFLSNIASSYREPQPVLQSWYEYQQPPRGTHIGTALVEFIAGESNATNSGCCHAQWSTGDSLWVWSLLSPAPRIIAEDVAWSLSAFPVTCLRFFCKRIFSVLVPMTSTTFY